MPDQLAELLPIGTTVNLIDLRSAGKKLFAGVIVDHDPVTRSYIVDRFEGGGRGPYAQAVEQIGHPVTMHDGHAPLPGEHYAINAITGSPDIAKTVTALIKRVDECISETTARVAKLEADNAVNLQRHQAAIETLIGFADADLAAAIRTALQHGVVAKPSVKPLLAPPIEPQPPAIEPEEEEELVTSGSPGKPRRK